MRLLFMGLGLIAIAGTVFLLRNSAATIEFPAFHDDRAKIAPTLQSDANDYREKLSALNALVQRAEELRIPRAYREEVTALEQEYTAIPASQFDVRFSTLREDMIEALEKETEKPKIAITFDAGAGSAPARDLIATLRRTRVKITFFSTGAWAEKNRDVFRDILVIDDKARNELGNHTWDHPHMVTDGLSDSAIRKEITDAEGEFQSLGFMAKPLFRYPYGEHDARTDALIADLGYRAVGWSFDALGWQHQLTPWQIADRAIQKAKPNSVILMHVGSQEDVDAFPLILTDLQNDYRFVFVSEI